MWAGAGGRPRGGQHGFGMSVVRDFNKYKKYNVHEFLDQLHPNTKDTEPPAAAAEEPAAVGEEPAGAAE